MTLGGRRAADSTFLILLLSVCWTTNNCHVTAFSSQPSSAAAAVSVFIHSRPRHRYSVFLEGNSHIQSQGQHHLALHHRKATQLKATATATASISGILVRPLSTVRTWSSSCLSGLLEGSGGGSGTVLTRVAVAAFTVIFLSALVASNVNRRNHNTSNAVINSFLWPNVQADPTVTEPLPPGSLGCPWLGSNNLAGNQRWGPEYYYRRASEKLGNPRVWMSYFLGSPYVIVSGKELVKEMNNLEFSKTAPMSAKSTAMTTTTTTMTTDKESMKAKRKKKPVVFGTNNLMFESDKDKHAFLRKLVGSAMTPQALKKALPTIQQTASDVIQRELVDPLLKKSDIGIPMENVCVDYTMDIVQRQFLGLNLPPQEVDAFRDKLKIWTKAFFQLSIPWLVTRSAPYQAKVYIETKLEEKIDSLIQNGPDTSIVSNMLFAVDENDNDDNAGSKKKKLSRDEVVENALLLVLAGAETSAGSLSLAMLLLGLNQDKYSQLVQEQKDVITTHGKQLTQTILDKECPYLEAVVKESLRMGPITGGFPRRALETIVVDGMQIPKDWLIFTTVRLSHQLDPVTCLPNDAHMDPYEGFQPERWLTPETTPADYMPFGSGPRYCLGYNLAMMEMKVFLAALARQVSSFELEKYASEATKRNPVRWNPSTIMPRPKDGVSIHCINQ